ncbi:MAG: AcrR family transcriptional regulator [Candidatus Latescibacterota bacterium]|jgi:AcrR family transcriptional regulator
MGKVERRKQILEEAARLFSSKRFDEVLMDEIAQGAGVAKGTLYTYFSDKEELYFSVIFEGISRLNEQIQAKAAGQKDPEKKLRKIVHSIVSFVSQNRFFFKLMSIEDSKSDTGKSENRSRWHEQKRIQLAVIQSVLVDGKRQGYFCVKHPEVEASILRDMVRSTITSAGGKLSVEEMVGTIMRIFVGGIQKDVPTVTA